MSDTAAGKPYATQPPAPPLVARDAPGLPWPVMPGGARGDLPDLNVWLALAVQEHPHHGAARRYWEEAQAQTALTTPGEAIVWFCRTTMLGLVRLLCQPKVVGEGALTLAAALAVYRQFRALPMVGLLPEPAGCDEQLQAFVSARTMPPRLWTDAWLAAQAKASGLRLVTFDADFLRFGLPRCVVLQAQ